MRRIALNHKARISYLLMGSVLALPLPAVADQPGGGAFRLRAVNDLRSEARAALDRLQRQRPNATARIDARTGLARCLKNVDAPAAVAPGNAVATVTAFVEEHRALLLGDRRVEELRLVGQERWENSTHVVFQQEYRGLPVWGARLSLHLDGEGAVRRAQGTVEPRLELETTPAITPTAAIDAAKRSVGAITVTGEPRATLGVLVERQEPRLVYRVELATVPPADWRVTVDARTGAVLRQMNRLQHVDGEGVVVEENLFTTPDLVTKPFPNLLGGGVLSGQFANVGSFDRFDRAGRLFGKRLSRATDHRFTAKTDDPAFDEQMLYYHINLGHRFFRDRFGFIGRDHALAVIAHMPDVEKVGNEIKGPMNNAFYSPGLDMLFFGDGTPGLGGRSNETSRDADVIYHEYTHAVVGRVVPNLTGETEYNVFGAALNEGYADYFACTINNDPDMAEFFQGLPGGLRNMENGYRYPEDINHPRLRKPESHWTGQIWGAACWDLRKRLGAEIADVLVFGSLYYLPQDGAATLPAAAEALIEADRQKHGGAHRDVIHEVMARRGLIAAAPIRG